ncbi:alkaline phosphatase family protein [Phyllobacterium sophorae]|uniref:Alkaline phosphatase family protein n=1 Tax=Phyllobacterium sophorae TaxID=1520277 RepID=A0A2P7B6S4_9HYPH|nr:alkaline phosphatase family protein [Phyllobacterium sophorae]PSH62162.1 alkaline phosphatase family protein [Phyllobacterium sophorae]
MQKKLISILVDGVSADTFEKHAHRLPNMRRLAERGLRVRRLKSTVPATSVPGRATMLTGVGPQVHGIYGNHIFSGDAFVTPLAEDLLAPTIATHASRAGLDVACIGHALIHPKDASVYVSPWWLRGYMTGSRFSKMVTPEALAASRAIHDPEDRLARAGLTEMDAFKDAADGGAPHLISGLALDQFLNRAVVALLGSDRAPDLLLTEIEMPDAFQHYLGYDSPAGIWSVEFADMLIGNLLAVLERTGRSDDYVIAVASDHGHGPVDTAIFPEAIIPDMNWMTEGASLYVSLKTPGDLERVAERLLPYGVELWQDHHVPESLRGRVAMFVAPPRHSFEERPSDASGSDASGPLLATGRPQLISTHGFRPGSPEDDRMFILSGAGIAPQIIEEADADQFTPTLARVLGLPLQPYAGPSLITEESHP